MRRNSPYIQNIVRIAFFAILIIYLGFSTQVTYLTPLLGVVSTYLVLNIAKKDKFFSLSLAIFYLLLFESSFNFYLFSFVLLIILQYKFILSLSKESSYNDLTIVVLNVLFSYIVYLLINNFISYLLNVELFDIDFKSYAIFIIVDIVISSVLFL